MTRSAKLGITSVVLLLIALLTLFPNWGSPVAFASVGLSGLFGLLAAQQGSRWWLTIPGLIIAGVSFGWWIAAHTS
jgi:hypothetical protein